MTSIELRRGDKFSITVTLTDPAGAALNIDVAQLAAQLYDVAGNKITDLTVAAGSGAGNYILSTIDDTADWPDIITTNIFDTTDLASSTEITVLMTRQLSRAVTP